MNQPVNARVNQLTNEPVTEPGSLVSRHRWTVGPVGGSSPSPTRPRLSGASVRCPPVGVPLGGPSGDGAATWPSDSRSPGWRHATGAAGWPTPETSSASSTAGRTTSCMVSGLRSAAGGGGGAVDRCEENARYDNDIDDAVPG